MAKIQLLNYNSQWELVKDEKCPIKNLGKAENPAQEASPGAAVALRIRQKRAI